MGAVGGARTLTVGSGTYNGTITDHGVAIAYGATTISYDTTGVLSLTKVSDETLTLGGTVSYTGLTNIQGGTLALTAAGATSLGNITMAANTRMTTAGAPESGGQFHADPGYKLFHRRGWGLRGRYVQPHPEWP